MVKLIARDVTHHRPISFAFKHRLKALRGDVSNVQRLIFFVEHRTTSRDQAIAGHLQSEWGPQAAVILTLAPMLQFAPLHDNLRCIV